jgi:L-alanine-DL-glutamate epimerase-like enolase superfamily enzyme
MEEGNTQTEAYGAIFKEGWKPNLAEWAVLENPGLGVDLSPEFLREHEVRADA